MASVAVTVKLNTPAVVGVPLRTPALESDRPVGTVPDVTAKLYGDVPPLAVIVWLYAVLNVPFGRVDGDSVMSGQPAVMMTV